MLYNLVVLSVFLFEMLIVYLFFAQQGELKRKKWVCYLLGVALFSAGAGIDMLFSNNVWMNSLAFLLIVFLFAVLNFEIRWSKALFCAVVLDVLSTAIEFVSLALMSLVTDTEINAYTNEITLLVIGGGTSKTLLFLFCILLSRVMQPEKTSVRFPATFYGYPVTVIAALLMLWGICVKYEVAGLYLAAVSVLCILLLFSSVMLFLTYQNTIKKENTISSLQSQMDKIKTDKRYYDILEKQNEELLLYAHDAKNHLNAIQNLNTDPQIEEYLTKMAEQLRNYSRVGHSGNRLLDIICSKYTAECELHGVSFLFDTRLANLKYVDDFDLVTILDNLLDNALEAAVASTEKRVELLTDHKNTYDVITVLNSCDVQPSVQGRRLLTTKGDTKNHGLGMKSVAKALRAYHGDFDWNYDADKKQFVVTVMLSPKR